MYLFHIKFHFIMFQSFRWIQAQLNGFSNFATNLRNHCPPPNQVEVPSSPQAVLTPCKSNKQLHRASSITLYTVYGRQFKCCVIVSLCDAVCLLSRAAQLVSRDLAVAAETSTASGARIIRDAHVLRVLGYVLAEEVLARRTMIAKRRYTSCCYI